jgi:hypothetical protein
MEGSGPRSVKIIADPDGPKTYGSYGFGSTTMDIPRARINKLPIQKNVQDPTRTRSVSKYKTLGTARSLPSLMKLDLKLPRSLGDVGVTKKMRLTYNSCRYLLQCFRSGSRVLITSTTKH